jgi:hypothetical protein
MTMTRKSLLLSSLFTLLIASPDFAHAQKEAPVMQKSVVQSSQAGPAPGPLKTWIDAENALIDPLNDKDKESFFILRNKYSVLRVIRIVGRDIGNAVKSCGSKNPDMKDKMEGRFKQWQGAVDPILDSAKKTLDQDIENQKIVDVKKARTVLKLNDEAYEFGDKQIAKTPVTTKEACQGLLDSMDRTEDQMVTLLQQTLLPESVIRKRGEDMDRKKAAADIAAKKREAAQPATNVPADGPQSLPDPKAQ